MKSRAKREAAAASEFGTMRDATAYELQLAQLNSDRARLKQIQSTEHKEALKKTLLPNYMPYVDGVLASNAGVQDDVVTTIMAWLIDVADYGNALWVASYVLEHRLKMPDQFERKPAAIITENIADAALKALKFGLNFDIEILTSLLVLVKSEDMHNQVLAKLHLAIGKLALSEVADDFDSADVTFYALLQNAEVHLIRAIELNEHCGGKNDLSKAQKLLKKVQDEQPDLVRKLEADAQLITSFEEQQPMAK